MSEYTFHSVDFRASYPLLEPLYRQHYSEMQARLEMDGVPISPFNPRLDQYSAGAERGDLLTFVVVRENETVIGYCNMWLTNDMHNGDLIAQEDAIYVLPGHRNGVGKRLARHILDVLQRRGVKRVSITPVTDLRVGKIWQRMGFKPVAQVMTYTFEETPDVRA